jgi:hypothetical protein
VYGIAGAIETVATRASARASARVAALNDWQRHRGPDNDVVVTVCACTLGNSRLATRDPSPAGFAYEVRPLPRPAPRLQLDTLAVARYLHLGAMALALAGARFGPGKAAICASLADSYLGKLAARPKRGFRVPMSRWLTESFASAFDAVSVPDAVVWTVTDRTAAERPGLLSGPGVRTRPAETWVLAALNAFIETVSPGPGRR